ncbi:MAG: 4'-phosphopantetheinyl transferase superfamily protein [Pseudomonadota bacterium]
MSDPSLLIKTQTLNATDVHIWYADVKDIGSLDASVISDEECERVSRFVFPADRARAKATRTFIRHLLSAYAGYSPNRWQFGENEHGRPRISGPKLTQELHFNLSHTNETIVCAIARLPLVGIDIESRVPNDFRQIAQRFFSLKEQQWLAREPDDERGSLRFLALWTLKEAYIKALGIGLSHPLQDFSILPQPSEDPRLIEDLNAQTNNVCWHFRLFNMRPKMPIALAVAFEQAGKPNVILNQYC